MDGTPIARRGDVVLMTYPDGSGQCFRGNIPAGPRKPNWHGFIKDAYWEPIDAVLKYSDDQPRDDHGRFSSDGGGELSDIESSALEHYLLTYGVNDTLRNGRQPGIYSLDSIIAKAPPLKDHASLYRSVSKEELSNIRSGNRYTDAAYISTARSETQAVGYNNGGTVRIDVPAGTRVLDVDTYRASLMGSMQGTRTGEVILPRGSTFDVSTEGDKTVLSLTSR